MAEKNDCSICLNGFNRPRKLDCCHTFCFKCLHDHIEKTSENNLFDCPLCRQQFSVPEGGLEEFMSNLNVAETSDGAKGKSAIVETSDGATGKSTIVETSDDVSEKSAIVETSDGATGKSAIVETSDGATGKSSIPSCEACKRDVPSEFRCRDCEQFLCSSCKTNHEFFNGCKDHKVVDAQNLVVPTTKDNSSYTDVCIHHPSNRARCYCRNCEQAICEDCFTSDHSGHAHIVIQNDDAREKVRAELKTLNQNLQTERNRHQHYLDILQELKTNINSSSEAANASIDKQVEEIYSQAKKRAEVIKEENEKLRREEEEKLGKLVKDGETLVEDINASVKYTGYVLDDTLMVKVIERKAKVEKEKMAVKMRKLDIPDVTYPWFEEGKINETQLSDQLGKLEIKNGLTFMSNFNFDGKQPGKVYEGDNFNVGGLWWYICAKKKTENDEDTLGIYLYATTAVKSCHAKFSLKLINHNNIKESEENHRDHRIFTSDVEGWGWTRFINWNRFSDKQNGFLTEDNKFTVQATVKVLKIEY